MSNPSTVTIPRRVLVSVLLVAAIAAVLVFARGGVSEGSTYTSNESQVYRDIAGTIRNTGSGWYVLNDTGHEPDDLTAIGTVTTTSVQVLFPECSQVVAMIAGPDDTYASSTWHATFGASVGFDNAVIKGSIKDGSDAGYLPDAWDPTTDFSGSSNIWFIGRCIPA
jgi:hypothetical protein